MKTNEVPQDDVPYFYEDLKRACYAVNDEGKYVIVPSVGWKIEEAINGLAVDELAAKLEETRKTVLAGLKSPLAYHMERRQMNPKLLAKTADIPKFKVKRHFRPEIFRKLEPAVLDRYAKALAITLEELKTVPE